MTFFSVPLFFINYLYTNNLCIYSIFIRRATKRGKKNILLNVEIELNPDLMAISGKDSSLTSTISLHIIYDKYSHNHKTSTHSAG